MKVLGLDTSAVLASVAVVENGELLSEYTQATAGKREPQLAGGTKHSEAILPLIQLALGDLGLELSDLAGLGISIGPGSFTGLRVGLSTAKGLAYGADIPVFAVRTLEAIAGRVWPQGGYEFVCPFMDARKGQVYAALYRWRSGAPHCLMEDTLDEPESVVRQVCSATTTECLFIGEGTRVYHELIERIMNGRARVTTGDGYPTTAAAVARIAEGRLKTGIPDPLDTLAPDYLRPPDVVPPKPRIG